MKARGLNAKPTTDLDRWFTSLRQRENRTKIRFSGQVSRRGRRRLVLRPLHARGFDSSSGWIMMLIGGSRNMVPYGNSTPWCKFHCRCKRQGKGLDPANRIRWLEARADHWEPSSFQASNQTESRNRSSRRRRRRSNWYIEGHSESSRSGGQEMNLKYAVIFEWAENNWSTYVPDLLGCMTTGRSREETEVIFGR